MRLFLMLAVAGILATAAPAYAQLRQVETPELRLVYVDPSETFLVPHAVRTVLNSLAFQRRLFGLDPDTRVNILPVDFQDGGNAGATAVPYNGVTIPIAPLRFALETLSGNDRMNIIINHELVHVATMDRPSSRDRGFRRLF